MCVFVYQCILYLCLSTCLVIQVWASGETLGGLHCTAPSTVGVFSALGAGTGSFTLLNNRVRKKSIPFSPFQFYIPKSPETTFMYLSFETWHKEGLQNAEGAKDFAWAIRGSEIFSQIFAELQNKLPKMWSSQKKGPKRFSKELLYLMVSIEK